MAELARMVTADAEIDASIREARLFEKYDIRVIRVTYSDRTDRFLLYLENGVTHSIPRWLLQGLSEAEPSALNRIELLGRGTGLYWPALDVAHSVSGLLAGVYGSAKWMKHLLESNPSRHLTAVGKGSSTVAVAGGRSGRSRDSDGRLEGRRGDTLIGTLREQNKKTFLAGRRSDAKLSTVRADANMSLTELVRQHQRGKK
jgi:hypothetical protein